MGTLYFAYGSNLSAVDLRAWCESRSLPALALKKIETAVLPDYELCFGRDSKAREGGVLDVRPARGFEVPGVLFEVTADDIVTLDRKEGHPKHYQRRDVQVRRADGSSAAAITYVGGPDGKSFVEPARTYLQVVREGWREHGLPLDVLEAAAGSGREEGDPPPRTFPIASSLFVYGTLLRGESRADTLRGFDQTGWLLAETRGEIVDCGSYPGLVSLDSTVRLPGELVVFEDERIEAVLAALDKVEGYEGFGRDDNLFERRLIEVDMGGGRMREAWTYSLAEPADGFAPVSGNDWRASRGRRTPFFAELARKHTQGLDVQSVVERVAAHPWRQQATLLAIRDVVDLAVALADDVLCERQLAQATGRWTVM